MNRYKQVNIVKDSTVYSANHQNSLGVVIPENRKYLAQHDDIACRNVKRGGVFNAHHTINQMYPIPVSCNNCHFALMLMSCSLLLPTERNGINITVNIMLPRPQTIELYIDKLIPVTKAVVLPERPAI